MSPHRRVAVVLAASAALATLGAATDGSARAADVARHYVALGDSYAAGPGIPAQRSDPIGCYRSTNNYPALLARALNIRNYIDVSCSGATTDNMTSAQPSPLGPNPPQFNALKPDTDLVTVTIGANDIDIGDLWSSCARLGPTDPLGSPCQRQSTAGGVDLYAQRVAAAAPKVARVLDGIRPGAAARRGWRWIRQPRNVRQPVTRPLGPFHRGRGWPAGVLAMYSSGTERATSLSNGDRMPTRRFAPRSDESPSRRCLTNLNTDRQQRRQFITE